MHELLGPYIPRRRHRVFAAHFVRNVLEGGMEKDEAIIAAAREAYPRRGKGTHAIGPTKDSYMKKLGLDALESDEVQAFVHQHLSEAGMDFSQMIEMHVKHIKGEVTHEVLDKEGNIISIKEAPSYQALKDAETLVLPPKVQKQEIRSFNVSMGGGAAPTVRARKTVKEITGGKDE